MFQEKIGKKIGSQVKVKLTETATESCSVEKIGKKIGGQSSYKKFKFVNSSGDSMLKILKTYLEEHF